MALGYISAFSETLALAVIIGHGVEALGEALEKETEVHIKVKHLLIPRPQLHGH
jgi:hypothetical protein